MQLHRFLLSLAILLLGTSLVYAEEIVNISYVKSPFNLQAIVMKQNGLLEKELSPLGVKPVWHEINSGARQAQAMAAGSLDISSAMNTTSIQMANGEGNPIKIVAGVSRPTDLFAIVAAKDGPATIQELKGKVVVGPKGTALHQLLVAALEKHGMKMDDIKFVQMDIPQAFAALESGQAQAALLAANTVIKAVESGGKILTTASGLITPKLAIAASENFIKSHPDRLKAVLNAHDKAWDWIKTHHNEAIELGAKEQGVDISTAEELYKNSHFTQKFSQDDLKSMDDDLNFMLQNGMMRNKVESQSLIESSAME